MTPAFLYSQIPLRPVFILTYSPITEFPFTSVNVLLIMQGLGNMILFKFEDGKMDFNRFAVLR